MAVKVFLARVRAGLVVPEPAATLPEGLAVSVVAELPETGLVAVDPEDAELIRALYEADRLRPLNDRSDGPAGGAP